MVDANSLLKTAPSVNEGDIAAIEAQLGLLLPSQLRAHYLKHNGGVPARRYFVDARGAEYEVARLMSMKQPAFAGDVLFETTYENIVKSKGLIPKDLVPFARGTGGDFYCMDRETGRVVFYAMDHSTEPTRAARTIAESLDAFLDGMQAEL